MLNLGVWLLAAVFSLVAGWTDWRSRRIPNWLTMPGLIAGLAYSTAAFGWAGAKSSLLGAGLGLGLLLPFVVIRSFGAGDWKLVGALGAILGPSRLLIVLLGTILVNGILALAMIIHKKRVRRTVRNIGILVSSLATFHMPGPELSIDHAEALNVPFGVAVAVTVLAFTASIAWRTL